MKNNNGQKAAFGVLDNTLNNSQGLTKREYFAAMILQGFIQSDKYAEMSDEDYIKRSLHMADELLTQLEK